MNKQTVWKFKPRFCEIDEHGHVHNSFYCVYVEEAIIDFCEINNLLDFKFFLGVDPIFFVHSFKIRFFSPLKSCDFAFVKTKVQNFTKTGIEFSSTIFLKSNLIVAEAKVIWVNFCTTKKIKKNFTETMLKNLTKIKT